jgi:2-C-methyl-D-erythritol 4-phosphate cytidylyltransferase
MVVAVILAAGSGLRFGGALPKQLVTLEGQPLLRWSVDAFCATATVDEIVLVTAPELVDDVRRLVPEASAVVAGGASRDASVREALHHLRDRPGDTHLLVHDAARPLVLPSTIAAAAAALARGAVACGVAVPASDTLLEVDAGIVTAIPDRSRLWQAQTPQGFRLDTLRAAHAAAIADPGFSPTDDCGVVDRYLPDVAVVVVAGQADNLKVTHAHDLAVAAALLRQRGTEQRPIV